MQKENFPALIELLTQYKHSYYNAMNDKEVEEVDSVIATAKKFSSENH